MFLAGAVEYDFFRKPDFKTLNFDEIFKESVEFKIQLMQHDQLCYTRAAMLFAAAAAVQSFNLTCQRETMNVEPYKPASLSFSNQLTFAS
jgi:hypothetical protein